LPAERVPAEFPGLDRERIQTLDRAMEFRGISHASNEYRLAVALRQEVLRTPLGLRFSETELAGEKDQRHFAMFGAEGTVAACVTAIPLADGRVKFRQMAVAPGLRSKGLGRTMLQAAEAAMREAGFVRATLHARRSAAGFYEKLGYRCKGREFTEVGIPHVEMEKDIRGTAPGATSLRRHEDGRHEACESHKPATKPGGTSAISRSSDSSDS
jgi:predicted GNAT family N-acyltransferase